MFETLLADLAVRHGEDGDVKAQLEEVGVHGDALCRLLPNGLWQLTAAKTFPICSHGRAAAAVAPGLQAYLEPSLSSARIG